MFGMSGAVIMVLALGTAVALFLLAAVGPLHRISRIMTRSFRCPFSDRDVTAEFQEDAWDGRPLEVIRCTAFSPPTAINCKRFCLHPEKFRAARMRATA